jgi:hypothetical protein
MPTRGAEAGPGLFVESYFWLNRREELNIGAMEHGFKRDIVI